MNRFILLMAFICALVACGSKVPGERVLFDFEADEELDRFHWRCYTLFSLSDEHATHGEKSLRLELYPSDYPGLSPVVQDRDWRGFKRLCFDIHNPEHEALGVVVRIDDQEDYPGYGDRYNHRFRLEPGTNRLCIPLDTLVTSRTRRKLDLRNVHRVLIFMVRLERKVVLFFDYIRLV